MAADDPPREADDAAEKPTEPAAREPEPSPSEPVATSDAAASAATPATAVRTTPKPRRTIPWWSFVLAALVVEFYIYGRSGHIEVCVGKQGETDFSLVGSERTDDNRWKFPRCESRLNLGLVSHSDQLVDEATLVACRGATIFRHQGEGKACTERKAGWEHRVDATQCPPWHGHFYEHLFWFLK